MSICFNLGRYVREKKLVPETKPQDQSLRVTSRLDEVEASVDAVINYLLPVHTIFLLQVGIKTRLDVFHDRLPAVRL
jgi:hypothetical protein